MYRWFVGVYGTVCNPFKDKVKVGRCRPHRFISYHSVVKKKKKKTFVEG